MSSDKRQFLRKKLECNVCISIPVVGRLSDISRSGARLSVDDAGALPDEFMVALNPELHRWCRVVWRNDHEVGVAFKGTPAKWLDWFSRKREEQPGQRSEAAGA
jgi:PilZ domain